MNIPLRLRLAVAYCAAFMVVIAVLEAGTYFAVRAAVDSIVDKELNTRLAGIEDHLNRHIGKYSWPRLAASFAEHPAFQPAYLMLRRSGGELLIGSPFLRGVPDNSYASAPRFATITSGYGVARILQVRRSILGISYEIALGTDLRIASGILNELWLVILLSAPLILAVASWIGYWLAGKALAPVSRMVAAAQAIDSSKLSERVDIPDTGDEIRLLAETINHMLARIEAGVENIRQFTANASHELRTPVAIIRASAEIALTQPGQNVRTYREALQRILRESERNSVLLNGMLEMARFDAGESGTHRVPVDLAMSLASICKQVQPLAASHDLNLSFCSDLDGVEVMAAADHLSRLWIALLENAIRYTPAGGSIHVSLEQADTGVKCVFRDTGIGIPSEHLPHLFERFYRVDKARSRANGGCGLGLSIATELAALYGAMIEVDSEVGIGSEFRVCFPAHVVTCSSHSIETAMAI